MGMSMENARDISQMNGAETEIPIAQPRKKLGLLWVVLGCVVVGVTLGIVVYQQSITPTKKPVTKSSSAPKPSSITSASPLPSPEVPDISVVNAQPKTVTFPKAGKVRIYYQGGAQNTNWLALGILIKNASGVASTYTIPAGKSTTPMQILDTGLDVAASETLTINSYWGTDASKLSVGWASPVSSKCGFNGFGQVSIASIVTWATEQSKGEPLVSTQCWGDYSPNANDTSSKDFNDYTLIVSYTPAGVSPTPISSPATSIAPSSTPTPTPTPTSTPRPSVVASSSPVAGTALLTSPTPSVRTTLPDTSEGVPVTGVFEITVGTVGVGLLLLVLGLAGLLVL